MISVLTLTYQRKNLLEEAIHSFLLQNTPYNTEMVILNDCNDVFYEFDHPKIRIINYPFRFPSISKKLQWGFNQCLFEYVYRLDDDDLLAPNALDNVINAINANPGYDIYRSFKNYFFTNNKFDKESINVNNGNVYSKNYLKRVNFKNKSFGEDFDITFKFGAKIYTLTESTMIYRWGMRTYHVSGCGDKNNTYIFERVDKIVSRRREYGNIILSPNFNQDYYKQII